MRRSLLDCSSKSECYVIQDGRQQVKSSFSKLLLQTSSPKTLGISGERFRSIWAPCLSYHDEIISTLESAEDVRAKFSNPQIIFCVDIESPPQKNGPRLQYRQFEGYLSLPRRQRTYIIVMHHDKMGLVTKSDQYIPRSACASTQSDRAV